MLNIKAGRDMVAAYEGAKDVYEGGKSLYGKNEDTESTAKKVYNKGRRHYKKVRVAIVSNIDGVDTKRWQL